MESKVTKHWHGRVPAADGHWIEVEFWLDDEEHESWRIFRRERPDEPNDDWRTYKLVADGRVKDKANYWIGVNRKTGKIARSKDAGLLYEFRPKLYEFLRVYALEVATDNRSDDLSDIL